MRRCAALLLSLLAGCGTTRLIDRPPEGYRALRVTETQRIPFALGHFELAAGSVYVGDRTDADGRQLWCNAALEYELRCIAWDGQRVTLRAAGTFPIGPLPLRPGVLEEFRLR